MVLRIDGFDDVVTITRATNCIIGIRVPKLTSLVNYNIITALMLLIYAGDGFRVNQ